MLDYSMPTYDICIPKGVGTPLIRDTGVTEEDIMAVMEWNSL